MILNRLTQEAESAAARYGMLTDSWRSVFHDALNASSFGYAVITEQAIAQAYEVAQAFLADERSRVERLALEIASEARQTTISELRSIATSELTVEALDHLSETERYLIDELVAQIHRDIALLRQTLQRIVLEVSIASRSRGVTERMALIEYRIDNQADLQFVFHDRHARKWASKKFVRAVWRHTLLATYNEVALLTMAEHGLTHARIAHQDADARSHGMIVAMSGSSEHPTYSEIRTEVFHPNANAILTAEGIDVSS